MAVWLGYHHLSGHFPGQLQHGRPCMVAQRSQKQRCRQPRRPLWLLSFRCRILSVRPIVLVVDSCLLRFPLQKFPPHEKAGKPQALQSQRSRFGIVSPAGVQPDYRTFPV